MSKALLAGYTLFPVIGR